MDRLPQEIINRMVMFLDRYPDREGVPNTLQQRVVVKSSALPPFATISSQWKEAVEFITFHRLDIRSEDLGELRTIVTRNRCKYLRNLKYSILLPEYPEEQGNRMESSEEQETNNEIFTHSIAELFSTLRQWEDAGVLSELRFNLAAPKSPSDYYDSESRFATTYLTLSEMDRIPKVSRISYFQIQGNYGRKISPSVGPQLMSILPGLKHIYAEFYEEGAQSASVERRSNFARLLEQTKLPASSVAMFNFHQEAPFDHREATSSSLLQGTLFDLFSASPRVFSQNLTTFILDAYVDATLFWPSIHESRAMPSWPSLKKLKISFNPVAPSGTWYFVGTPRDEEDTQFMQHGNRDTLDPFLIAFAKATQQMPVLESFMLECEIGYKVGFFELSYYAPGVKADWSLDWGDEDTATVRRLYYTVGDVWRPDAFVEETLRDIGRERHGPELIERFLGHRSWSSQSAWGWF
ncbi:unnamed protein product [Alternaria alternata]